MERIDVTNEDAGVQLRRLIDKLGGMDLFFYASGIGKQNRELSADIELATVQTNAIGFTRMIGEAYRYFAEKGEGHIAAITSIAGTKGLGPAPSYSATKAMQATYLQALEQQAHQRGLMKPEKVAKEIMYAIRHHQHVRIIDWRYRLLTALWRRIPKAVWRKLKL